MRLFVFSVVFVLACPGCQQPSTPPASPVSQIETAAMNSLTKAGGVLKTDDSGHVVDADLRKAEISTATLEPLAELPGLKSLNLSGTTFGDEHLTAAGNSTPAWAEKLSGRVTNLDLRDCRLSDAAMPAIGRFTALRALRFSGKNGNTTISDEGLKALQPLSSLKVLALDDLWITSAGIAAIADLRNLEELYLAATVVDDDAIAVIAKLPSLKKLRLARTSVGDAAIASLTACRGLEELDLSENSIVTDAGLEHLAKMTSLKKLNLWRLQISDTGALHLATLKNLNWLNLDNTKLSDAGLAALKDMNQLTFLHLGSTQITEAGAPALFHLKSLKDLKITRTALGASETAVAELRKNLPDTAIQVEYEGQ